MAKKAYIRKTTTWKGKRYEVRAETEKEALEKLVVLKEQLRRGEKSDGENMTVSDWFADSDSVCEGSNPSPAANNRNPGKP